MDSIKREIKKILILAYDFPPYVSVGGLRPHSWYKYLHEYGVYPVVITRQWENKFGNHFDYIAPGKYQQSIIEKSEQGTIISSPYFPNLSNKLMLKYGASKYILIRKIISAYYEFAQWLFFIGPKSQLYYAAKEYLKTNKVDAIVATGDPFILFKYAAKLSKKYKVPWIADYRDPWTNNKDTFRDFIMNRWDAFFEKKCISNVSAILTVSEFFKSRETSLLKKSFIYVLPNGYDPVAIEKTIKIKQLSDELNIGFVGTIYKWHPIRSFISVISNFLSEHQDAKLSINLYGINIKKELEEMISKNFPHIQKNINILPKMANDALLLELAKNNLMVLFNDYSKIGTKIYDYIAIKRAILLCYSNDSEAMTLKRKYFKLGKIDGLSDHCQEDIIYETNSGYVVRNKNHLQELLVQLYDVFKEKGFIECNTINFEQFSRKRQAERLAEIIKEI